MQMSSSFTLPPDQPNGAVPSDSKQDILKKLQQASKMNFERKKQTMLGASKIKQSSALQMNGQLTLDQMQLDRRDEF